MKESKMSKAIAPSLPRKLFNLAQELGGDVIDLSLGDPDVETPIEIRNAACEAIQSGKTRYSANAGLIDVRQAYANFFEKHYGYSISPSKNVMTTVGGLESLYLALATIVDAGDEVILLEPYYANYREIINMFGGKAIIVNRLNRNDSDIIKDIQCSVSSKTASILINSPCNPSGEIFTSELLDGVITIVLQNDLIAICDEVYSSLAYDGNTVPSILNNSRMLDHAVLVDSCSKRFAMTGWRIGFAVGPEEIISNMTKMQENVAACTPLPSQYAAIKGYAEDFDYSYIREIYERRRNLVFDRLNSIKCMKPIKPQATFYCFVDISSTGINGESFAYDLLKKKHVAVVPGRTYGENYTNYIRIAFTVKDKLINEAMNRIQDYCKENFDS